MNSSRDNKQLITWKRYLLMFLLLGVSANPFMGQQIEAFIIVGLCFIFYADSSVFRININNEVKYLLIVLFFISFEFIHRILFGLNNFYTIIRILGYFAFAYFAVKALKIKFIDTYINVIYYLAVISLIFYGVSITPGINLQAYNFADSLFPLENDWSNFRSPTLLIFTFTPGYIKGGDLYLRNAGFTWEAGTFGIFLNLAIFLYIIREKLALNRILRKRKTIILIIALITTFSTTAFIVFSLYITFFSFKEKGIKKYIMLLMVSFTIYYSFSSLDFLNNKINSQIEEANNSQNRFGSALLDLADALKRPWFGWSRDSRVLFGLDANSKVDHRPNGLTNHLRKYGFINTIALLLFLYVSFNKYFVFLNKRNASSLALLALLIILLSSFSELIYDKVFIRALLFLPLVYNPQTNKLKKKTNKF